MKGVSFQSAIGKQFQATIGLRMKIRCNPLLVEFRIKFSVLIIQSFSPKGNAKQISCKLYLQKVAPHIVYNLCIIHKMYINLYCSSLGIPLHLDIFHFFVATHEGHAHSWGQLTPSDGPSIQMTLKTKAARNKSTS